MIPFKIAESDWALRPRIINPSVAVVSEASATAYV
jgi:hypothetical protein